MFGWLKRIFSSTSTTTRVSSDTTGRKVESESTEWSGVKRTSSSWKVVDSRVTYTENGNVVYEGSLDDMPPELRAKYDRLMAQGMAMLNEQSENLNRMMADMNSNMADMQAQMKKAFDNPFFHGKWH